MIDMASIIDKLKHCVNDKSVCSDCPTVSDCRIDTSICMIDTETKEELIKEITEVENKHLSKLWKKADVLKVVDHKIKLDINNPKHKEWFEEE